MAGVSGRVLPLKRLVALGEDDDEAAVRRDAASARDAVAAADWRWCGGRVAAAVAPRPAEPGAFVFRDLDADTTTVVSKGGGERGRGPSRGGPADVSVFWDTHATDRPARPWTRAEGTHAPFLGTAKRSGVSLSRPSGHPRRASR